MLMVDEILLFAVITRSHSVLLDFFNSCLNLINLPVLSPILHFVPLTMLCQPFYAFSCLRFVLLMLFDVAIIHFFFGMSIAGQLLRVCSADCCPHF